MPACSALNCGFRSAGRKSKKQVKYELSHGTVRFYRIPKDPFRQSQWIEAMGRIDWTPSPTTAICSRHFRPEDTYETFKRIMLKDDVVPSIFGPVDVGEKSDKPKKKKEKEDDDSKKSQPTSDVQKLKAVRKPSSKPKESTSEEKPKEKKKQSKSESADEKSDQDDDDANNDEALANDDSDAGESEPLTLASLAQTLLSLKNEIHGIQKKKRDGSPAGSESGQSADGNNSEPEETTRNTRKRKVDMTDFPSSSSDDEPLISRKKASKSSQSKKSSPGKKKKEEKKEKKYVRPSKIPQPPATNRTFTATELFLLQHIAKADNFTRREHDSQKASQRRKVVSLQQSVRRKERRIGKLLQEIRSLKRKQTSNDDQLKLLDSIGGTGRSLLKCIAQIEKKGTRYASTPEMKRFAGTLYDHSPSAYMFVRETFDFTLPHPKTISKWRRSDLDEKDMIITLKDPEPASDPAEVEARGFDKTKEIQDSNHAVMNIPSLQPPKELGSIADVITTGFATLLHD